MGFITRALRAGIARTHTYAGKHVVVTGGTRGLGFELARQLLAAGASVTICGRSPETLTRALAALGGGAALHGIACDVRDRNACEDLVVQSVRRFGPIDVLINNAGIIGVGPVATQSLADFEDALATHLWAPLYTIFAVLPAMRARRSGAIVNVASVGGLVAVPHLLPYSVSKFAQIGLSQGLAAELARDGITVTAVAPGTLITGSPDHATFRGQSRKEFAWFALSDANPLISVRAETAARRILRACARGDSFLTVGWTASLARTLNALSPDLMATLLRVAATLLPDAGERAGGARLGFESHSPIVDGPLTASSRAEGRTHNEFPYD